MGWKIWVLMAVLVALFALPARAQEKEYRVTFGSVLEVSAGQLVVMEYDYTEDNEKKAVYLINEETGYENIASIGDLGAGDTVEIVYVEENGARWAQTVRKELIFEDEEPWGEDGETFDSYSDFGQNDSRS